MTLHADDEPIGRVFSRREALAMLGATGWYLVTGCSSAEATGNTDSGSCVVRPALTEGPYFVDEKLNRSDIRIDPSDGSIKAGALLALTVNVSRLAAASCTPLVGALVDLWHCDGLGIYSDVNDPGFNTVGKKFLRGYQVADANGTVNFTTIYPGWYSGRATHIHFKIRSPSDLPVVLRRQLVGCHSKRCPLHQRDRGPAAEYRRRDLQPGRLSADPSGRRGGFRIRGDLQPRGADGLTSA